MGRAAQRVGRGRRAPSPPTRNYEPMAFEDGCERTDRGQLDAGVGAQEHGSQLLGPPRSGSRAAVRAPRAVCELAARQEPIGPFVGRLSAHSEAAAELRHAVQLFEILVDEGFALLHE